MVTVKDPNWIQNGSWAAVLWLWKTIHLVQYHQEIGSTDFRCKKTSNFDFSLSTHWYANQFFLSSITFMSKISIKTVQLFFSQNLFHSSSWKFKMARSLPPGRGEIFQLSKLNFFCREVIWHEGFATDARRPAMPPRIRQQGICRRHPPDWSQGTPTFIKNHQNYWIVNCTSDFFVIWHILLKPINGNQLWNFNNQ